MLPRASRPLTACTRMPSHFHSAIKSAASRCVKSASSIACASITGRNGAGSRLTGFCRAAFQPREQVEIGWGEPRPHQLDLVRILVAERGGGGLGQPRRNADPHRAGDEFQQRPAAGLVEFVEPARQLLRQFGLAERAQRGDDLGERRRRRVVVETVVVRNTVLAVPLSLALPHKGGGDRKSRRRGCFRCAGFGSVARRSLSKLRGSLPPCGGGLGRGVATQRNLAMRRLWPHQRHRFGKVADIIIRQCEQHRIGAHRRSGRGSVRAWRA